MTRAVIKLKRIYEEPASNDGLRVLVDRLWPRGVLKERAQLDAWLKELAPSTELRQWFNHDPEKWLEFKKRYRQELKDSQVLEELQEMIKQNKVITLLFAAKDEAHNEAVVLKEIL
ncbi:MAG: DUF488 domain-containing protein [Patescibacteria group bacterium]|jgi:uncharacterized protein YeaO (DUF488 family)